MVTGIDFNWFYTTDVGEEFSNYTVGKKYNDVTVTSIFQNGKPGCESEWKVNFDDATSQLIYNVSRAYLKEE